MMRDEAVVKANDTWHDSMPQLVLKKIIKFTKSWCEWIFPNLPKRLKFWKRTK